MTDSRFIDRLTRRFVNEKTLVDARDRTPDALGLADVRAMIEDNIQAIGQGGDLTEILKAERLFLENDLGRYANSKAMTSSLRTALAELAAAERHAAVVDDPGRYRAIDESHSLPKNRVGGVPKDEARQFFKSHAARLLNQDKSRLDPEEKKILDRRKANMRLAEDIYAARQRRTLGLKPVRRRDRGPSL